VQFIVKYQFIALWRGNMMHLTRLGDDYHVVK